MAHKVIVPKKKFMSRSFLNSGTLIVIFLKKMVLLMEVAVSLFLAILHAHINSQLWL
jgi:hypothetical protein